MGDVVFTSQCCMVRRYGEKMAGMANRFIILHRHYPDTVALINYFTNSTEKRKRDASTAESSTTINTHSSFAEN